jgi:hypothetical protein
VTLRGRKRRVVDQAVISKVGVVESLSSRDTPLRVEMKHVRQQVIGNGITHFTWLLMFTR